MIRITEEIRLSIDNLLLYIICINNHLQLKYFSSLFSFRFNDSGLFVYFFFIGILTSMIELFSCYFCLTDKSLSNLKSMYALSSLLSVSSSSSHIGISFGN